MNSKTEQQILKLYRDYHDSPPSLAGLVKRNLGRYLLMAFVAVLGTVALYRLQSPSPAILIAGMLLGALLRDVGTFRRFIKTWPVTDSVLDWRRIDAWLNVESD